MSTSIGAKEERIADLFASGYTTAQIACETGYGVSTVYLKLKHPLVRARIAEARAAVLRPIRDLVVGELRANVACLAAIRNDPDESSRTKIAAIAELNGMFLKLEPMTEDAPLRAQLEAVLAPPDTDDASTDA